MLPRGARLSRSEDIAAVVRHGRRVVMPWARVYWRQGASPSHRITCVVGTRIAASSYRRHRYQRWLRVLAAELLPLWRTPSDIVWVAASGITQCESLASLRQHTVPIITDRLTAT